MAKMTLLDITQDIANDLDTDEISSINDTVESIQIAQIVKTTYFELIANRNWPHLKRTVHLDSSGSTSLPTHLKLPTEIKEVVSFNYNKIKEADLTRDRYESIEYMEPEYFLRKINGRNVNNDNVEKITDVGGIDILVFNDRQPTYYTSFDDEYIVCDSYNSDIESTLQSSQTQVIAFVDPTWSHEDSFTPDLPSEAFPLLLEEAKSTAFVTLKQTANEKAEQKSRRQNRWLSRKSWRVSGGVRYPDFGRKSVGYTGRSTRNSTLFDKDN